MSRPVFYLFKILTLAAVGYYLRESFLAYRDNLQDLRLFLLVIGDFYSVILVLAAVYTPQVSSGLVIMMVTSVSTCYYVFMNLTGGVVIVPYRYGQYIQIAGILLQIAAKVTIGRRFGLLPANRGVVTAGPYRWVRHPMYLGYFLNHAGFLLCTFSWHNAVVLAVLYVFVIFRLFKEEEFLRQDPAYQAYAARVRYRWLPGVF